MRWLLLLRLFSCQFLLGQLSQVLLVGGRIKSLLVGTDWEIVRRPTPSESARSLTELLDSYIDRCFPLKSRKATSNDKPWFDSNSRRKVNKKLRIYKKEDKSEKYKRARKEADEVLEEAKKNFFDNVLERCKKAKNSKGYYQAAKMMQTKEAPIIWNVMSLMPGKSEEEVADAIAQFFNSISLEYPSLPDPTKEWNVDMPRIIEECEVPAKLKSIKNPNLLYTVILTQPWSRNLRISSPNPFVSCSIKCSTLCLGLKYRISSSLEQSLSLGSWILGRAIGEKWLSPSDDTSLPETPLSPNETVAAVWMARVSSVPMRPSSSVAQQNRKFPNMLPCGEPPGTVLRLDISVPAFTCIVLPLKKALTSAISAFSAPNELSELIH